MERARSLLILLRSGAPHGALRTLLDVAGSAEAALEAGPSAWRTVALAEAQTAALLAPDQRRIDADLEWLGQPGHHLVGWADPDYPALLRNGSNPPAALFIVGDPALLWHPQVAVVGSRRPTAGGRDNARSFAQRFAEAGLAVVSGLAEGIDTAAHQGALSRFRTLAVLGTGPDLCFPAANADLMDVIACTGALVTEHPPGTPGLRQHFPSRNRLIAALALGTVVIEAAVRSGALITARLAAEAGREVFALPGSIHNPMSRGCHRLIRQGAGLAESPEEVVAALKPMAETLAWALRGRLEGIAGDLEPAAEAVVPSGSGEQRVWSALGHDPVNLDQLSERTGLTVGPLSAMLLAMELNGKISAAHGRYSRRS